LPVVSSLFLPLRLSLQALPPPSCPSSLSVVAPTIPFRRLSLSLPSPPHLSLSPPRWEPATSVLFSHPPKQQELVTVQSSLLACCLMHWVLVTFQQPYCRKKSTSPQPVRRVGHVTPYYENEFFPKFSKTRQITL
jgi:hypothetical protein